MFHDLHNNSAYAAPTLRSIFEQMGYTQEYGKKWNAMSKMEQKKIEKQIKKDQVA